MYYGVLFLFVAIALAAGNRNLSKRLAAVEDHGAVARLAKRSEGHFCCKNIPIEVVTKTRSVSRLRVDKTKEKVGTESCGVFGLGKCSKYEFRYKQVQYYTTVYYSEPVTGACKGKAITCCNGYFYIKKYKKCVLLSELSEVIKQLEAAKAAEKEAQ